MSSEGADVAAPVVDVQGDRRWMDLHEQFVADSMNKEPDVLFVGDSLIERLQYSIVWSEFFEPLHCLNFGIGGDTTQNVLWRLENGEIDNIKPKVVVVLVGTNNHEHTAEAVVKGIEAIALHIRSKQPSAHIIVLAIPPRGKNDNPLRAKLSKINELVKDKISAIPDAEFFDPKAELIQPDGTIDRSDLGDFLHLTPQGYRKYCKPLADKLDELIVVED